MTVRHLRQLLDGLPDDAPVLSICDVDGLPDVAEAVVVHAREVREHDAGWEHFERPRKGTRRAVLVSA